MLVASHLLSGFQSTRRREDAKTRRREDAKTRRREDTKTRRREDAKKKERTTTWPRPDEKNGGDEGNGITTEERRNRGATELNRR